MTPISRNARAGYNGETRFLESRADLVSGRLLLICSLAEVTALFDRIARWIRVRERQDAYALSVSGKLHGTIAAIEECLTTSHAVLVVAHFPSTFFQLQEILEPSSIDYRIVQSPLTPNAMLDEMEQTEKPLVLLALADLLDTETDAKTQPSNQQQASIIMCERHPLLAREGVVRKFGESIGCRVIIGRLASFEDPTVFPFLGEWTELVMKQLGFNDQFLMHSEIVSRRLERGYRRLEKLMGEEQPADSPEEWMKLNIPKAMKRRLIHKRRKTW